MSNKLLILASLLLAAFVINLDTTLINVALPSLTRELGATTSQLQWIVDAYNLVFASLLLTAGSLSDRLGRKGMLLTGLLLFGAASVVGSLVASPAALVAARAVMGVGAAMTFPPTLSLLTNVFTDRRERAIAIGLWGATAGVAIALGPIVGGFLLQHYSWSSIFLAMGPVALAAVGMVAVVSPTSRDHHPGKVDVLGLAFSAAFMAVLIFTIIEAPASGWGSARTLAGFGASAALLMAFVARERSTVAPMLDVRLFANRRFSAASASVTISFLTLSGFIFLMTQYFQFLRAYSALSTGVHLLPVAGSVALGSVVGTRLAVRLGTRSIVTLGLILQGAFYVWVASTISTTIGYGTIALQMATFGLGMGLTSAPATESIMGAVSDRRAGVGSAVNDSTRLLGGTLGVAVIGSIYASLYSTRLSTALPRRLPQGLADLIRQSVGSAFEVAQRLGSRGHGELSRQVRYAASVAFLHGLSVGCVVAGTTAIGGALVAAIYLPAQPAPHPMATTDAEVTFA